MADLRHRKEHLQPLLRPQDVPRLCPHPQGVREDDYEGYGEFGGQDIYALVAYWNKGVADRNVGIDIACYDKDNAALKYPIKIASRSNAVYEKCGPSNSCPDQGYFY